MYLEKVKPILKEIDQLRNKQAKLEKSLNAVESDIAAKLEAVQALVNGSDSDELSV